MKITKEKIYGWVCRNEGYAVIIVVLLFMVFMYFGYSVVNHFVRDQNGQKVLLWELGYNSMDTVIREALFSDWENLLVVVEDDSVRIRTVHATYFEHSGWSWLRMFEGKTLSGFSPPPKSYRVLGHEVRVMDYDNYKVGPIKK